MKTKIFILALFIFPLTTMGQITPKNLTEVKVTPPAFTGIQLVSDEPDGQGKLFARHLLENFEYPVKAMQCGIQGTGVVQFVVQPDGKLTDFIVINSICPELDDEFIRVIKTTDGMWNPGLNNGNPVEMEKEVSMMFVANQQNKTNPKEYFAKMATNHFVKANTLFLEKHNLKKALRNYDQTIKYFPYDASSLLVRGLCKYGLGDLEGARSDWERINRLGSFDASTLMDEMNSLKGYDEMIAIIEK